MDDTRRFSISLISRELNIVVNPDVLSIAFTRILVIKSFIFKYELLECKENAP